MYDTQKSQFRIITKEKKVKYAGTDYPSWFTLAEAKNIVNYDNGEAIYFDNGERLVCEVL